MDLGLEDWRVLVTGATNGIGAAIAAELIAEGAAVVGAGRAPVADRQVPGARATLGVDLTDEGGPEQLVAEAVDVLGGLDALVLNAGGATKARFEGSTDDVIAGSLELNVMSSVRAMRAALPELRRRPGRILLVTALSAKEPREGQLPSNIAKAGQSALAKSASREFAADGILVNCLAPGRIRSQQVDRIWDEDARADFAAAHIPLGRFGDPQETAAIAALLVSPRNTYITGEIVHVDGGMSLATF
jgi:3-oxoacyl-[acyl-carrier protein] reductase